MCSDQRGERCKRRVNRQRRRDHIRRIAMGPRQDKAGSDTQNGSDDGHWRRAGSCYSRCMARREVEGLISKLRQLSEEGATSFFSEVMASERLRKRLGRAGERFLSNKQNFDHNVESILDFVNIPSKRDVRDLKSRLDTLSTQLVNLSMKVDRMLAQKEPQQRRPRGGKGKAPAS